MTVPILNLLAFLAASLLVIALVFYWWAEDYIKSLVCLVAFALVGAVAYIKSVCLVAFALVGAVAYCEWRAAFGVFDLVPYVVGASIVLSIVFRILRRENDV